MELNIYIGTKWLVMAAAGGWDRVLGLQRVVVATRRRHHLVQAVGGGLQFVRQSTDLGQGNEVGGLRVERSAGVSLQCPATHLVSDGNLRTMTL